MDSQETSPRDLMPTAIQRARAYAVHVYTASGVALAFFAAAEICHPTPDVRLVFIFLFVAVAIDATDGVLARRWRVKVWADRVDGRTIDDIVDYLTYTFVPLLLMWRMEWLPSPAALWILPAMIASLFGFANSQAKDEAGGFFLGFPSYWNVVAFYAGLFGGPAVAPTTGVITLTLALLTILPVRFLYPNLTPAPWRVPVLAGALVWMGMLIALLASYPHGPRWLLWSSLLYPVFYTLLSLHLHREQTRTASA